MEGCKPDNRVGLVAGFITVPLPKVNPVGPNSKILVEETPCQLIVADDGFILVAVSWVGAGQFNVPVKEISSMLVAEQSEPKKILLRLFLIACKVTVTVSF